MRLTIEHRIGLARASHAVDEHCRIEPAQNISNRLTHGPFKDLQVACSLSEHFLVVEDAFGLSGIVRWKYFHFFVTGDAQTISPRMSSGAGFDPEEDLEVFLEGGGGRFFGRVWSLPFWLSVGLPLWPAHSNYTLGKKINHWPSRAAASKSRGPTGPPLHVTASRGVCDPRG